MPRGRAPSCLCGSCKKCTDREKSRARRADPAYAQAERERARERMAAIRSDPVRAERERQARAEIDARRKYDKVERDITSHSLMFRSMKAAHRELTLALFAFGEDGDLSDEVVERLAASGRVLERAARSVARARSRYSPDDRVSLTPLGASMLAECKIDAGE